MFTLLLALLAPASASALGSVGIQGGVQVVDGETFLGGHVRLDLATIGQKARLQVYPNLDVFFFDQDVTRWSIDIDLIIPVDVGSFFEPYGGLGIGITHSVFEPAGSETVGDLNLIGGFDFNFGAPLHPFVETEASIAGSDVISIMAGLGFHF